MTRFSRRVIGACLLKPAVYEEVEADEGATAQAAMLVAAASLASGIGLLDLGAPSLPAVILGAAGGLAGWVSWAALTYLIGTRLLPEPSTRADLGQLLRTLAFASAPGVLQVFGVIPAVHTVVFGVVSIWMLVAMVVAVRQALDYTSTARAVGVCLVGWALSVAIAVVIGTALAPAVS